MLNRKGDSIMLLDKIDNSSPNSEKISLNPGTPNGTTSKGFETQRAVRLLMESLRFPAIRDIILDSIQFIRVILAN